MDMEQEDEKKEPVTRRVVAEDGTIEEFESKEEAREKLTDQLKTVTVKPDNYKEREVDSLEDLIYGDESTEEDSDPDALDTTKFTGSSNLTQTQYVKILKPRFVTGQDALEDFQQSDSDDEEMKENDQYRAEKMGHEKQAPIDRRMEQDEKTKAERV